MAQYLMSVWHDDNYEVDFEAEENQRVFRQVGAFNQELMDAGAWVFGGGLHPAASATVLRPSAGEVSMTDGPYAETKEQMGGFWVVEAPDLDAALEWGRKGAAACEGPVEVRPFQDV
jgi:hypothetical protein